MKMWFGRCLWVFPLLFWISCGSSISLRHNMLFRRNKHHLKEQPLENLTLNCDEVKFFIRQVPGDGGCLFHAIASWISYIKLHLHPKFDWKMRSISNKLRRIAITTLTSNQTLHIENDDIIDGYTLLDVVCKQYNMSQGDYCRIMLDPKTWGGGPEIIAISNHMKCPIYIYQLNSTGTKRFEKPKFCLTLFTKVGSPKYDDVEPLHLLCCDGR